MEPGSAETPPETEMSAGRPEGWSAGRQLLTIAGGIAAVGAVLLMTFRWAEHRADAELLLRYCDNPQRHLSVLRNVLMEDPVGGGGIDTAERRSRMVAAKLLFLEPRRADEPVDVYVARLQARLEGACG